MPRFLATLSAAICPCVFAPVASLAQPAFYIRLSPEWSLLRIEHTKALTDSSGSSSNTATATGPGVAMNLSVGYLAAASGSWLAGGELQVGISLPQSIDGSMPATGRGPGAVGPGTWDFGNRLGVGANLLVGRETTRRKLRSYILAGVKRWTAGASSRAIHPEHGEFSYRDEGVRWQWTAGIGVTVLRERRVDFRLLYFGSGAAMDWSVTTRVDPNSDDPNAPTLTWDYSFTGSGFGLQIGFGTG